LNDFCHLKGDDEFSWWIHLYLIETWWERDALSSAALVEVVCYIDLRPCQQLEVVQSFVTGKDTFVALPTEYGKSVLFAVLTKW